MIQLLIGIILGIFVATVGFSGLVKVADEGVTAVKQKSKQMVK